MLMSREPTSSSRFGPNNISSVDDDRALQTDSEGM